MNTEKHDRLYISTCFTANKPLTQKQWQAIQDAMKEALEDMIMDSNTFTKQLGNVYIDTPWGNAGGEICV